MTVSDAYQQLLNQIDYLYAPPPVDDTALLREAMWPFRARSIDIETHLDLDYLRYKLVATIPNLPYFRWEEHVDRDKLLDAPDLHELRIWLAERLAAYYKSIPRVEPEENIILGED